MAGDALSANLQLANAMGGFAKFLFGSQPTTTTTEEGGTTTTKQTTLTQDAVNGLLRQMQEGGLSGNGVPGTGTAGLAAIMSGEKSAGLYNSNVTSQLMSKNAAAIAQNVALASAATTTTTNPNSRNSVVKTPGIVSPATGALGLGALALLSPSVRKGAKSLYDSIGENVSDSPYDVGQNLVNNPVAFGTADVAYDAGENLVNNFAADTGASFVTDAVGDQAADFGFDVGANLVNDFGGDLLAESALDFGVPYVSLITKGLPILGDITGINELTDLGNFVQEGVDAITEPVVDAVSSVWNAINPCFITTAICKAHGKPDDCMELTTLRNWRDSYGMTHFPEEVAEYYRIAPAIVEAINAKPDAEQIWKSLRIKLIQVIDDVIGGDNLSAHHGYNQLVDLAKEQANG